MEALVYVAGVLNDSDLPKAHCCACHSHTFSDLKKKIVLHLVSTESLRLLSKVCEKHCGVTIFVLKVPVQQLTMN